MSDDILAARARSRPGLPVAIVIGGCGGMGMACVRRLAQHHAVVIADLDGARAEQAAAALAAEGYSVAGAGCDATDAAAVAALFAHAARLGPVTAIAHVLGLSPSMADAPTILTVNLVAPALVAEAALAHMPPGGAAVFVSSIAGHGTRVPDAVQPILDAPLDPDFRASITAALPDLTSSDAYRFSKATLLRFCRRNAAAWGARGLRINSLSPGLIRTPMGDREFDRSPAKGALLQRIPLERQGELTEIADGLEFLLSNKASFITGTDLLIDGGLVATNEPG
ncbi:SDR family oxidoreductase [Sphingomonas immobilis]|uniref:SDR family oxidoreductase n=1 Tax=Sphingomonas immobilis TaxID=3063997 RepID=A0ABT8ZX18_9SPHN|nr:SDR family oxidoreductase [Sphingomonas sp. CA1-15]MDO7842123.1 SDR family oxidoreductase [Sphingomonas sp. CA1-15]